MSPSPDNGHGLDNAAESLLGHAQTSRSVRPDSSSGSNQRRGHVTYLGRLSSRRIPLLLFCVAGLTLITLFIRGSDSTNALRSVTSVLGSRPIVAEVPIDTLPPNSGHSEPIASYRFGEINLPEWPLLNYSAGVARVMPMPEEDFEADVDTHPIAELIARGSRTAAEHEARKKAVDSLEKAVEDYERAFGMSPPEGFERWYKFAVSVNATAVPSLIPYAHETILPFLAMPPAMLRKRAWERLGANGMMAFQFNPENEDPEERLRIHGGDGTTWSRFHAQDYPTLLAPIIPLLPPSPGDEPLALKIWTEDAGLRIVSGSVLAKSRELAKQGLVWDDEELAEAEAERRGENGWGNVCETPLNWTDGKEARDALGGQHHEAASFVSDPLEYMNVCEHPEHLLMNGDMIMKESTQVSVWEPVVVCSRLMGGSEMLSAPTRDYDQIVKHEVPWSEKEDSRLFFRGGPSGIFYTTWRWDWRSSQRNRLSVVGDESVEYDVPVMVDRGDSGIVRESFAHSELVERYLDVRLVPQALLWDCSVKWSDGLMCRPNAGEQYLDDCPGNKDGCFDMLESTSWGRRVSLEQSLKYKFHIDVDGFGWTTRWRKELSTGSVVLKATLFPEWWHAQAIPWYHYVPVRYDYSDVFDIMAYFTGSPDGETEGRDDLAEQIGVQGRAFALNQLKWEDMQSYMFLFLLEYRRAWADDRQAATYHGEIAMEAEGW